MDTIAGRRVSRLINLNDLVLADKENVEVDNVEPPTTPQKSLVRPPVPPKPAILRGGDSQSPAHSKIKKPFSPAARSSYNNRHRSGSRTSKGFGDGLPSPALNLSQKSLWTATPQAVPTTFTPLKSASVPDEHDQTTSAKASDSVIADSIAPKTSSTPNTSASRLNINLTESPLFIRRAPGLFTREDSSKVPPASAETPFKFKVTVGPNKREVVAEVADALLSSSSSSFASLASSASSISSSSASTPRRDYIPINMPRLTTTDSISSSSHSVLNDSYSSLSRRSGASVAAVSSSSSSSANSSSASIGSTRKRENCDYSESPAKRRRISIGTKSTRQTIVTGLPLSTLNGTGTSSGREIPTAASIFAAPGTTTSSRSRSNSVNDSDSSVAANSISSSMPVLQIPSTPSSTGLSSSVQTPAATPLGISTSQLQSAFGASTTAHLTVPASKDSEVPLSIEEIAAWVIFGQDDPEITKAFLLSFIHFKTTAKDLFKMIWQFYYQPPLQYWKLMSTFSNQRSRVVSFVTTWTSISPGDFDLSPPPPQTPGVPLPKEKTSKIPLKFYLKFLETLKADGANSDELDLSSARKTSSTNSQEQTPAKSAPPASPRRSLSKRQSKFGARRQSSVKAGTTSPNFMQFEPADFAVQLTVFELRLLKAVPLSELVGQAWNKTDKELNAPRVTNIINHFNRMSFWVGQEISQGENAKDQGKRMDRFISVAKKLKDIGNFNGLMEIFSGLMSSTVQKLTEAWKTVPSRQMARLKKIEGLMSPFQNAAAYRTRLAEFPKCPVIPYFGVHLSDIVHLIEGVEDEVPDKYALQKVLKLGSMISCWHSWQKQQIDAPEDIDIIQFILTLKATVSSSGPQ